MECTFVFRVGEVISALVNKFTIQEMEKNSKRKNIHNFIIKIHKHIKCNKFIEINMKIYCLKQIEDV